MARPRDKKILLSEEQVKRLKKVLKSSKICDTVKNRCRILLDLDMSHGKQPTYEQCAHRNGVSKATVASIIGMFFSGLTVSSELMEPLIRTTSILDEHVMEVDMKKCRFVSDDFVRVTDGPFEGVVGRVARVARQHRVVVYIEGLQAGLTTAYIPPYYLEKVDQ